MPDSETTFNDGSKVVIVADTEDCPPESEFVDSEEFIENPTGDEVAMGKLLGQEIDIDDDEDNGAATIKAVKEASQ